MANNPTAIACHEAKKIWPNRPIECVVSIGTGLRQKKPAKPGMSGLLESLIASATSTERVNDILTDFLSEDVYFRFNPEHISFDSALDELRPEMHEAMQQAAREYVQENIGTFLKLAKILKREEAAPMEM